MWERELLGIDVYYIISWFIIYSFIGWIAESTYMSICNRKLTNRGFMFGPFCPIYGVGALCVYFILRPFSGNIVALYFAGAILATIFEYLIAKLMQVVFGEVWWDYSDKPFNYKNIICLESTLAWGLYTVFMFKFLHEIVNEVIERFSYRRGIQLITIVLAIIMIDMIIHIVREKREFINDRVGTIKEKLRGIRS